MMITKHLLPQDELELPRPRILNGEVHKTAYTQRSSPPGREQSCRVQLTVMQALSARLQQQEQRGKRLEALLAQHQSLSERQTQQHRAEVTALHTALRDAHLRLQQTDQVFEEQV
jgi:hypothetical protein